MFVNIIGKKVAIYTLGCKVNQYESDCMADMLAKEGCEIVGFTGYSDIYIINTCSVTNMAEKKSRQIIHRARRNNRDAVVVVCGCYVNAAKEQLEKDLDIDIIIGNNCKKNIARLIDEFIGEKQVEDNYIDIGATNEFESMTMIKPTEHCRAYVKVQDGCNNFCTYCIIPYTRGRIRSRSYEDVIAEVEGLASRGIKEVVLTGINLSSYEYGEYKLTELLLGVAAIDGIRRVRMGSLEPRIITEDFLNRISNNPKICPHFHLSLQSACNETLARMNRRYTIEEYMEKCELIRSYYDRPAITTDVIVGFPGETDEEFATTCENLSRLKLYEMHIFKYSKRAGTKAAVMREQVREEIKDERSKVLLEMTAKHKAEFESTFVGQEIEVLFEEYEKKDGVCILKGHTDRYIMARYEADEEYCKGHINSIERIRFEG